MASSAPSSSAVKAHILLVDDNKGGLVARRSVLEELGFRVTTALEPREALKHFQREKVDLVVTDYRMPGMSGEEFIAKLRECQPAIPVVLISGFVEPLGLNEESTGADIVIQKSANEVSQLIRAVNRLLRRVPAKKPPLTQPAAKKSRERAG